MKRRLHVVYVCADKGVPVGGWKGSSAHVAELTHALGAAGAEVRLIAARTSNGNGGPGHTIDLGAERAIRRMRQVLTAANGHSRPATATEVYGLLLNHGLGKALDRLHRQWRIDAIYERYSLWSFAAASFAHAAGIPYLLEVNAPLRVEQRRYRTLENPVAAAGLEAYLFQLADYVILPAAELRPYVAQHGGRRGRIRVVPNAADPTRYVSATSRTSPQDEFVIGFLGTLKPWHGLEDLIRVFRHLRRRFAGYKLLIAGDGPLRRVLERSLRRHGLMRYATFTGQLEHAQVPACLARMHVGTAPYPPLAGFYFSPLKVYEYMAAGLPVVASDIGQIGAVLKHGRTALLHRPGRVREMVEAIEALRLSPSLAGRLGSNGRKLLLRRFTWERNAAHVLGLIETSRPQVQRAARQPRRS
jgi:glycosyltransferase involved in cell wall biosynthesis